MRENRTYGSEGGEAPSLPDPYPVGATSSSRKARSGDGPPTCRSDVLVAKGSARGRASYL